MNTIKYSWDEFEFDISSLLLWLTYIEYKPNYIVGVVRGGAVPAIKLSHKLKIPVKLVEWSTRDSGYRDIKTLETIAASIKRDKNVLIVDDICDSGKTISELKYNIGLGSDRIKWCSLWHNPSSKMNMDWYARCIDRTVDERWVIMPWE